ncbi:hypothetical protein Bca4012_073235 [Brassica carinata]|uniref:Leucine-rich repeat-containing N-terminal plant-type domain-containing protein n=2 Tax=Brassica TaxID=3705 RepID=A0A0D3CHB0_BRAOL|nr:receptor-like protein 53 [Brassica napus]KAH0879894.1 hypothetical protein HID58_067288 [Brassica napus]CAF1931287.1 unnamed protein product [Brassica napus]
MIGTIFLLFFYISSSSYTYASLTLCRPDQRDALLEFKSEFNDEGIQGAWTSFCVTSSPKRKSWENNTDCCYWDGITCDANSGVVIGLDLSSSCLHGHFKPNSSLFRLQYLRSLNLAYNDFNASSIPTRINELMGLQRLDLSYTSFSGKIPTEILHLTKLVSLDLSSIFMYPQTLSSPGKPFLSQLAQNLTNLRQLDLSHVNLSSEIPQVMMSNLTSLRSIRLHDCNLFGKFPRLSPTIRSIDLSVNPNLESSLPEFDANNSLVYLDVTDTSLSGSIPDSVSNLKHLKVLTCFNCKFTGKIPFSIGNLSHLNILDLGYNNLAGEVPSSFQNLNRMTDLFLVNNKLSGKIPTALFNLTKLSVLKLASNQFTGTLPLNITSLSNLNVFHAASNSFVGTIPSTFFNIPSLVSLDLGDNQFSGPLEIGNISSMSKLQSLDLSKNNLTGAIPTSISKLVSLVSLDLSYFNIRGPLDIGIFWHLKSLQQLTLSHINTTTSIDLNAVLSLPLKSLYILDLSGSHVAVENTSSVSTVSSQQLENVYLSGCGITVFPELIRSLQYIFIIDLSNNNIKGQVPAWLWRVATNVNLSNNTISGFKEFPKDLFSRRAIKTLYLSNNNFSKEIPRSICEMTSLGIVDLSNNNFSGSVPYCLNNLIRRSLSVLNLANNHLSGKLADIFANECILRSLNVGHNQLVGELPRSLLDCSSLEVLNMEHNRINDTFPFWLESLPNLHILVLRSNEFHGSLQYHPKVASFYPQLRIIDISHNDFTGTLPSDLFMYWQAMHSERDGSQLEYIGQGPYYHDSIVLMNKGIEMEYTMILTIFTSIDISGNRLQGIIPGSIGQVKAVIVLNLSSNGFVGNIPSSLANLNQLESLDLSHNKLSGHIPPDLGQWTSLSTIRVSHNKLVGVIPTSTQFQTQNASGFEDNVGLCGPPLDQCRVGNDDSPLTQQEEDDKEEVLSCHRFRTWYRAWIKHWALQVTIIEGAG